MGEQQSARPYSPGRRTGLRERSRLAVRDARLHEALRTATDRFAGHREAGFAPLGNADELRDAARAVRARTIANLPDLLGQLADNVERLGGHVCWASTAQDATRYILDVAARTGARLTVKSKSMASEEIHLNDALQGQGIEVVETDLGEWIIQLAGETPSHIIAPAIHKRRADVADLFSGVAGERLPGDAESLCAFARQRLREAFLRADVGVSGVNFGVAETGSIVLVTNEGNGRMVTSLPRVHVAVMGMERIVETWEELDLMLALLPRAASGQQISTYVTAITGPRRPGEPDGPDELHLVILDNGRSDVLGTEFQEILHCIRCGACLNVCPVYRQMGGHAYASVYSGPVGAVLTPLLRSAERSGELAGATSLCGACWQACPVRIPLQDLLLAHRRRNAAHAGVAERAGWRAWAEAWSRPAVYRASVRAAAAGARRLPGPLVPRRWSAGREAPRPPRTPGLRSWLESGDTG